MFVSATFEFSINKGRAGSVRNLAYDPKLTPSVKFGHFKINIFGTHPVTSANVNKKTISNFYLSMTRATHILIYFFSKSKYGF